MLVSHTILQNRYRVIRELGHGGMGTVYEALDQRVSCIVALKETSTGNNTEARSAFEREAALLANLRHSALPKVMDYFSEGESDFLVMEFIPGYDLADLLELRGSPFPQGQVLGWADNLLKVLDYLHGQNPPILHRDIKPSNLKLTKQGEIFLLDFGLAKGAAGQMRTLVTSRSVRGYTPRYASLEQIHGHGTDPRSDLYSLAATLYHLLTGVAPVPAPKRFSELEDERPDPSPLIEEVNHQVSANVAAVIRQAMSISRRQRPASASEMRKALRHAIEEDERQSAGEEYRRAEVIQQQREVERKAAADLEREAEERRKLEAETRRKEAEALRLAAEGEARRKAEGEAARRAEEETRRRVAQEESRKSAAEETRRLAEQKALRLATEERRRHEEETRRRAADEETRQRTDFAKVADQPAIETTQAAPGTEPVSGNQSTLRVPISQSAEFGSPYPKPSKNPKRSGIVIIATVGVLTVIVIGAIVIAAVVFSKLGSGVGTTNGSSSDGSHPQPAPGSQSNTTVGAANIEMVLVPAGAFTMGSPDSEVDRTKDEGPQRQVSVRSFYMGKYEVSQAQYQAVMGSNPSNFKDCGRNCPVEQVSWDEAQSFINKLNGLNDGFTYRLPTEAEWEYACRAGTTTPFAFGDSLSSAQANFDGNYPYGGAAKEVYPGKTTQVGSFQPNRFGLYDMHGNVWEWCEDFYHDNYDGAPTDGSAWLSGGEQKYRVLRGGSWITFARYLRSALRDGRPPGVRFDTYGFRVVAVVSTQ